MISSFLTILYVLLQGVVDSVYIIPSFQYHFFFHDARFVDSLFHINTFVTVTVRLPAVQDK